MADFVVLPSPDPNRERSEREKRALNAALKANEQTRQALGIRRKSMAGNPDLLPKPVRNYGGVLQRTITAKDWRDAGFKETFSPRNVMRALGEDPDACRCRMRHVCTRHGMNEDECGGRCQWVDSQDSTERPILIIGGSRP